MDAAERKALSQSVARLRARWVEIWRSAARFKEVGFRGFKDQAGADLLAHTVSVEIQISVNGQQLFEQYGDFIVDIGVVGHLH